MAGLIFFSSLILLQYGLTFYWLAQKKYSHFILLQVYSIFSYDFIFINASFYLPPLLLNILKPYNEYLLLYFTCYFFFVLKRRFSLSNYTDCGLLLLLLFPSIVILLLHDFTRTINVLETIKGLRTYLLPVLLPYLIYRCDIFRHYRQAVIVNALFAFCLAIGLYGCYQNLVFTGHVRSLWFYDFFDQYRINPVAYQPSNFIRNGALRVTSIFVSPLTYSIVLTVPLLMVLSIFLNSGKALRPVTRLALAAFGMFMLYCQWTAVTRIGIIADAIGFALLLAVRFIKKPSFLLLLAIPLGVIAVTFCTLLSGVTKELSAMGRLAQFKSFFGYFSITGLGFNHKLVLTYFDSYFISLGLVYGSLVSFPLLWLYTVNRRAHLVMCVRKNYFNTAIFALSLTFIYTFTFQFVAGSAAYRLYFLLLFLIFTNEQFSNRGDIEADTYRFIWNRHFRFGHAQIDKGEQ